jgi:hypothetical protein
MQTIGLIGEIQAAAIPALRVAFTIALLVLAAAGLFIYHKRHQFFVRDPNVDNDVPLVPAQSRGRDHSRLDRYDAGAAFYPLLGLERRS